MSSVLKANTTLQHTSHHTHNTTQHNTTQHNTTQHNTTQHNTQQKAIPYQAAILCIKSHCNIHATQIQQEQVHCGAVEYPHLYMDSDLSQHPTARTSPSIAPALLGGPLGTAFDPPKPPTPGINTMQNTGALRSMRWISSPSWFLKEMTPLCIPIAIVNPSGDHATDKILEPTFSFVTCF